MTQKTRLAYQISDHLWDHYETLLEMHQMSTLDRTTLRLEINALFNRIHESVLECREEDNTLFPAGTAGNILTENPVAPGKTPQSFLSEGRIIYMYKKEHPLDKKICVFCVIPPGHPLYLNTYREIHPDGRERYIGENHNVLPAFDKDAWLIGIRCPQPSEESWVTEEEMDFVKSTFKLLVDQHKPKYERESS